MELKPAPTLPADGYGLTRTYASSTRLNLQHFLWKDTLGYNIHPAIPIHEHGKGIRIADIGTGTSIWPIDVSHEQPEAAIDAFDISLDQCPPQQWLPKSISIHKLDIYSPLPPDLIEKYDIVNVRLFLCAVRNNEPLPVLKTLLKMLKPGGYLQWSEHNFFTTTIGAAQSKRQHSAMDKLNQALLASKAGQWVPSLSATFSEQGLIDVQRGQYAVKPHFRSFFTQMTCMSVEEFSWAVLDNSSAEGSGPLCRRVIKEASEELKDGFALNYILEAVIGRKAFS